MRSTSLRILALAAFLILGACANENSDELTPEQKEHIQTMRETRRQQKADQEREQREIQDGKYLQEQETPANGEDRTQTEPREEKAPEQTPEVVLPETAPTPQPRPVTEEKTTEPQTEKAPVQTPEVVLPETAPIPQPRPVVEATPVPKPAATPAPKKTVPSTQKVSAPESGKCSYISGLSSKPPRGRVVMTFDDGPSAKLTPELLAVLKKYRIRATFFMLGEEATANLSVARTVRAAGHLVGSHGWNHPNFHKLDWATQKSQIDRAANVLEDLFPTQKYFRYPYGNSTCQGNAYLHRMGYAIVGWHIDSCDWAFAENGRVSAEDAEICGVSAANRANFVGHVVAQVKAHQGGIILMHDIHSRTVHQVETLIEELLRQGFEFTNLDDPELQGSLR